MNVFEFRRFKNWLDKTDYRVKESDAFIRECGLGRHYQFDSWKYFTEYGNKNFIINGDYIEFDTPVDENGNTYNNSDACHLFYAPEWAHYSSKKFYGDYKHIKIHYHKFSQPLRSSINNKREYYWF